LPILECEPAARAILDGDELDVVEGRIRNRATDATFDATPLAAGGPVAYTPPEARTEKSAGPQGLRSPS
jgi:hypothetical protein